MFIDRSFIFPPECAPSVFATQYAHHQFSVRLRGPDSILSSSASPLLVISCRCLCLMAKCAHRETRGGRPLSSAISPKAGIHANFFLCPFGCSKVSTEQRGQRERNECPPPECQALMAVFRTEVKSLAEQGLVARR